MGEAGVFVVGVCIGLLAVIHRKEIQFFVTDKYRRIKNGR